MLIFPLIASRVLDRFNDLNPSYETLIKSRRTPRIDQ